MLKKFQLLQEIAPSDEVASLDLRVAALIVAIKRVAKVTLQRGIWP